MIYKWQNSKLLLFEVGLFLYSGIHINIQATYEYMSGLILLNTLDYT